MRYSSLTCPYRNYGLTLIEMIVALAVLTILIALGVPSLSTLSIRNEQTTSLNGFLTHFYLARSQAIQQEQHIIICPTSGGERCRDEAIWSDGLIIFEDSQRDGILGPDEPILAKYLLPEHAELTIRSSEHRKRVVYHGDGRPSGYNLTLSFCDPKERIKPKALIVNNVGRIRISERGAGDAPIKCDQ
ncbi:MAG: GspH/FimT family pseudopilin [Candidatus Thiodiazotropha endolucinida]|nr:GspH/FimT family pseudopilin [Candidatus Thiodiazotropha taylori]MCW4241379.1 GspH/FimT family pseudopilin [Candidatus Thiodiazotropha taylori]